MRHEQTHGEDTSKTLDHHQKRCTSTPCRTVFGVVVDLTFRLHDVSKFLGGQMVIVDDLQGTKFK